MLSFLRFERVRIAYPRPRQQGLHRIGLGLEKKASGLVAESLHEILRSLEQRALDCTIISSLHLPAAYPFDHMVGTREDMRDMFSYAVAYTVTIAQVLLNSKAV